MKVRILFTEPVRFVGHFHVILLTWSAHLELLLQQKGSGFLVDAIQFVKRIIGDYIHFFFDKCFPKHQFTSGFKQNDDDW